MAQAVKQEILNAIDRSGMVLQGDSFRMRHRTKGNGDPCTFEHDDPAMVVTRISNGWLFHCHRCHTSGTLSDGGLSPKQTRARVEALKKIPVNKVTEKVDLPHDFEAMSERVDHDAVPWSAYHWLWKYQLCKEDILKYGIGWSPSYKRVIIPLYEYAHLGEGIAKKLVGWIGRDPEVRTKDDRKKKGIPKYLTRAKKGRRRYFMTMGDEDNVVICEDCISAIKVNLATGYTTIALLQTAVGNDLMRWLRGRTVYLWLDGDMNTLSIQTVKRMSELGIKSHSIRTTKDPKEYNSLYIRDLIRGGSDGYDTDEG